MTVNCGYISVKVLVLHVAIITYNTGIHTDVTVAEWDLFVDLFHKECDWKIMLLKFTNTQF